MQPSASTKLKHRYLRKAIEEYEYSPASEYERSEMTSKAAHTGTVDFSYDDPDRDVELSPPGDGAWVTARVWVPKEWLD
jgi:hypothetical protein